MTKDEWGALSLIVTAGAYTAYLWQTGRERDIQPHPISWLLFTLSTGIAYLAQKARGAAAGDWTTELTALVCFMIFAASLIKYTVLYRRLKQRGLIPEEKLHSPSNLISFWSSALAILLFVFAKTPEGAAFFATGADFIAYWPTLKKGMRQPFTDSTTSFGLNCAKFVIALFAMNSYSFATVVFPATVGVMNACVVVLLMYGRKRIVFSGRPWSVEIAWRCFKSEWGYPIQRRTT